MRNLRLTLSYDGTDFHGWQRQPGLRTVQGELEAALGRLTGAPPVCNASGRTDAGVHALGQVVNFRTEAAHPASVVHKALNALLPRDVRVRDVAEVSPEFHATLDAVAKRYRYVLDNGRVADPFLLRYAWHVLDRLDAGSMHRAGRVLIGRHDFRSFETRGSPRASSIRTVVDLDVTRADDTVVLEVEADGFLYNMARAIAGTLVLVGAGRRPESWPGTALAARSRAEAGPTAPPQGLFLLRIRYEPCASSTSSPG